VGRDLKEGKEQLKVVLLNRVISIGMLEKGDFKGDKAERLENGLENLYE